MNSMKQTLTSDQMGIGIARSAIDLEKEMPRRATMKPDKPFEEVQVSENAVWRWVREGNLYVNRMTQEHMNQFKKDIDAARLEEREAIAALVEADGRVHPKAPDAVWAKTVAKLIRARSKK
jgi:hypothetical protein